MTSSNNKKVKTTQDSDMHLHLIALLRVMCQDILIGNSSFSAATGRHLRIDEIVRRSAPKEERDVMRHLYILEGHKLVSPHPTGVFTSRIWYVTAEGVKLMKSINRQMPIAA